MSKRKRVVQAKKILAPSRTSQAKQEDQVRAEDLSPFSFLSDDTFIDILSRLSTRFLLSSCSLVCHRWNALINSNLVREISPSIFAPTSSPWRLRGKNVSLKEVIAKYSSTLELLDVHGLPTTSTHAAVIMNTLNQLPELRGLVIDGNQLNFVVGGLKAIAGIVPRRFQRLRVIGGIHEQAGQTSSNSSKAAIDDSGFFRQFQQLTNLASLTLTAHITVKDLNSLAAYLPNLKDLDLSSPSLGWDAIHKILDSCIHLSQLSVMSAAFEETPLMDTGGEAFPGNLVNRRLRSQHERNKNIMRLNHGPSSITSLRLYSKPGLSVSVGSAEYLELLRSFGDQLRTLHAQGLFNSDWQRLGVWCPSLQSLDLSHECPLDMTAVEKLVLSGLLRMLRKVKRLALPTINDLLLITLGQNSSSLQELRFQGFSKTLVENMNVSSLGIRHLAEGCRDLRVLNLSGCKMVDTVAIRSLSVNCEQLKFLSLQDCKLLDDKCVLLLITRLHSSLVFLDVRGCMISCDLAHKLLEFSSTSDVALKVLVISNSLMKKFKTEWNKLQRSIPGLDIRGGHTGIEWNGILSSQDFRFI